MCVCVWAAEGLVAREILTYRAPLPAALSLASTSQRKRSAAARLICNLSFPLTSVSPPFSCHCLSFSASTLQDFLFVIPTSHCTNHNTFFNPLSILTFTAEQLSLLFPLFSFHSPSLLTSCCSLFLFLTIICLSSPLVPYFTLSLLGRLMWLGPVVLIW